MTRTARVILLILAALIAALAVGILCSREAQSAEVADRAQGRSRSTRSR